MVRFRDIQDVLRKRRSIKKERQSLAAMHRPDSNQRKIRRSMMEWSELSTLRRLLHGNAGKTNIKVAKRR